jgi:hypothetical protein
MVTARPDAEPSWVRWHNVPSPYATDNTGMSTAETEPAAIDPQVLADLDAAMKRISGGAAVDPETSRRIEERADRITEEIRRTRGVTDGEDSRPPGKQRDWNSARWARILAHRANTRICKAVRGTWASKLPAHLSWL